MEKKHLYVIGLVVLVIAGAIGYPYVRWLQFRLDTQKALKDIGRFASAEEVAAVPAKVKQIAERRGFGDATIRVVLEEFGDGPAKLYFLLVEAKSGSHEFRTDRRGRQIDTKVTYEFLEILREAGVTIRRSREGGGGVSDAIAPMVPGAQ